jgi:hypothetical protein
LISGNQNNNLEFKFQLSSQIISEILNLKLVSWNIKFQVQIKIFEINMSILDSIKFFWIEILIFRFENNNLGFKYQFLDQISFLNLNKQFPELNCQFSDSNNIFKIEMSILRLN